LQQATVLPAGPPPGLLAQPQISDAAALDAEQPTAIAPPFHAATDADDMQRATKCLTAAVYYEARSQSLAGQEAVAQVVLNRVRNPAFPHSVCGTVYEGSSRDTGCQFTFTCDGSLSQRIEPAAWDRARKVATAALNGFVFTPVGNATYYHTTAVNPWWAPRLAKVAQIGAHIFYRMPGRWGGSLAFNQSYSGSEPAVSAGTEFREKPITQIVSAIEAGVRVHRAGEGAVPGEIMARSFGVRVHRAIESDPGRDLVTGLPIVHDNETPSIAGAT
jgi:hypothetical protein